MMLIASYSAIVFTAPVLSARIDSAIQDTFTGLPHGCTSPHTATIGSDFAFLTDPLVQYGAYRGTQRELWNDRVPVPARPLFPRNCDSSADTLKAPAQISGLTPAIGIRASAATAEQAICGHHFTQQKG